MGVIGNGGPPPRTVIVRQGDHAASDDPSVVFSALLGSCVALCLHDPVARCGGMTHTIHAAGLARAQDVALRLNDFETVFNAIMRMGARRERLHVSVVGGAHVIGIGREVGTELVRHILSLICREGLIPRYMDIRGRQARQIRFGPATGTLDVRRVADAHVPDAPIRRPKPVGVELF